MVFILTLLAYIWNMAHQTGMFRRRIFSKFGILLAIQLGTVVLALGVTVLIAVFMDAVSLSMSWYSQPWIIFGLYFCPMFFLLGILPAIYLSRTKEHGLPLAYAIQLLMHAHCLILTVITVIMISFGIRSAFVIMLCIAFYTLSVIVNIVTCFHKKSESARSLFEKRFNLVFVFQISSGSYHIPFARFYPSCSTRTFATPFMLHSFQWKVAMAPIAIRTLWLEDLPHWCACYLRLFWWVSREHLLCIKW